MNKYKFIDYLHRPKSIPTDQQQKLVEVIEDYPYFQTARTLVAKVKNIQKDSSSRSFVNSTALYVFDRAFFKKYLEADLFFIEPREELKQREEKAKQAPNEPERKRKQPTDHSKKQPAPEKQQVKKTQQKHSQDNNAAKPAQKASVAQLPKTKAQPSPAQSKEPVNKTLKSLVPPETSDLDRLIEEVYKDMAELRKSKARFIMWQEKNDMEEAIEKAMASSKEQLDKPDKNKDSSKEEASKAAGTDAPKPTADDKKKQEIAEKSESKAQIVADEKETADQAEGPETKKSVAKPKKAPAKKTAGKKTPAKTVTKKSTVKASKKGSVGDKASSSSKKTTVKKATTQSAAKEASDTSTGKKSKSTTEKKGAKTSASKKTQAKPKEPKNEASASLKKAEPASKSKGSVAASKPKKAPESKISAEKPKAGTKDQEKIIDKFIETQPTISKPDADSEIPKGDLSQSSTRFHADIASEYLAEIYIEQGKKHRAIEIYENLSLKFPEKKSYFAGLIKNLKKE